MVAAPHSASVVHSPHRSPTSSHDAASQGASPVGIQLPPAQTSGPLHQMPSSQFRSAQSGSPQPTRPSQSSSSRFRQSSTGSHGLSVPHRFVSRSQKSPGPQDVRLQPATHIPPSQMKSSSQSGSQLGASTSPASGRGPTSVREVTALHPPLTQNRPISQSSLRVHAGGAPEAQAPKHTTSIARTQIT